MKYYKISISGYGGEVVFGAATLQQFEFWNDKDRLQEAGFDDTEYALVEYMYDIEEWEQNIPKTARLTKEWYELDDYGHFNGSTHDSSYLTIEEISEEKEDAVVWEGSIIKFIKQTKSSIENNEFNIDDVLPENSNYIFYAMSIEKGQFFEGTLTLDSELDFSKFKFVFCDLPNSDSLLEDICYGDTSIENFGGDTRGKSMTMEIWNW